MKLQGKVVVLTGAGSGIGKALALHLLAKGAKVAAVDVNEAALRELTTTAPSEQLSIHNLDITDLEKVALLPQQVQERWGAVDGLINNAGIIQPFVRVKDLEYPAIERVMRVNFYGMLYMTKAFLPQLLERLEAHIVNISSMGGFLPVPGQTVYGASKAAVKLFTEGLYAELIDTPVRVTVVFPGAVATDIAAHSGVQIGERTGQNSGIKPLAPEKAAQIILEGVEQNRFRVLVGSDAKLMDFLYRLNPGYAARLIYRRMKSLLG